MCAQRIQISMRRSVRIISIAKDVRLLQLRRTADAQSDWCLRLTRESKGIQSNLNHSNTNGSFTMAKSNSFLSPYDFFPIDQENKYLENLSDPEIVCCVYSLVSHIEAILMSTLNIQLLCRK